MIDSMEMPLTEGIYTDEWFQAWLNRQLREVRALCPNNASWQEHSYHKVMLDLSSPGTLVKHIPGARRRLVLEENDSYWKAFLDQSYGKIWDENWPLFLAQKGIIKYADDWVDNYSLGAFVNNRKENFRGVYV